MNGSTDIKSSLVYIELCHTIDNIYTALTGKTISSEMAAQLMQKAMQRKEYRRPLINIISEYIQNGTKRDYLQTQIQHALSLEGMLSLNDVRAAHEEQDRTDDEESADKTIKDVRQK